MGYNTPVLLLNDALHEIENDPTVAKRIAQASATAHMMGKPVDVSAGEHLCVDCQSLRDDNKPSFKEPWAT